jgi:hypothetical protein
MAVQVLCSSKLGARIPGAGIIRREGVFTMTTEPIVPDTTKAAKSETPRKPRVASEAKTATVSLRAADGSVMYIVAERTKTGAKTYVITQNAGKKPARGMTEMHSDMEAAKKTIAARAVQAEKLGWTRRVAGRVFQPKPDAFTTLPPAPKGKK